MSEFTQVWPDMHGRSVTVDTQPRVTALEERVRQLEIAVLMVGTHPALSVPPMLIPTPSWIDGKPSFSEKLRQTMQLWGWYG